MVLKFMAGIQDIFGSMVFGDEVMRQRLPRDTYRALHRTIAEGGRLDPELAGVVANAMKDWALEKGATHFTHWFQPMTGITAEKHDSFISPIPGGGVIMEFGGKELVRGEPDASSLPSGGLRATFEARGYTAWDPTSYAFIKDNTLYIPTAYCSYGGQALDKKTPLLRSMEALNKQALRILKLFGRPDTRVMPTVGAEQEYFLIDRELYQKREDLLYCGRTLFGARPPKGQELDDHFFGTIKPRVKDFMRETDEELWKLGVLCKTEHNEVAPAQHEMASIYTTANIACDHNQLTMEVMRRVAAKHGLACLLHEKPFAGVNGSGKHNNWSLATDTGMNLLEPGETPAENAQFLLFLVAFLKAVDLHADLLRVSAASASNDCRLGGNEAPPAVISIYLGEELNAILDALENHRAYTAQDRIEMNVGVKTLPRIPKDTTDRNRTSPLAFTGNKFEFRMPGSSMSVSDANVVLNTIMADALREFADTLEQAVDLRASVEELIVDTISKHKRILFDGNNYSDAWREEAKKRGLPSLPTLPDAISSLLKPENIELFSRMKVFTAQELQSRYEVTLESYCKVVSIEAHTMLDMTARQIIPAIVRYKKDLAQAASMQKIVLLDEAPVAEEKLLADLAKLLQTIIGRQVALKKTLDKAELETDLFKRACMNRDAVLPAMADLRAQVDAAEIVTNETVWPMPTYGDLMTRV